MSNRSNHNARSSTLLLLDKIQRDWTASSLSPYLSAEVLEFVTNDLSRIEPATKIRVLLSLLTLQNSEELEPSIRKLLSACKADGSEDWVGVVAPLVERQLPHLFQNDQSKTQKDPAKTISRLHSSIERIKDKLIQAEKASSLQNLKLPLNFVPMEFPYLEKSLLPQKLDLNTVEDKHFTPRGQDKTLLVKMGVGEQHKDGSLSQQSITVRKQEAKTFHISDSIREKAALRRSTGSIKVLDMKDIEKARGGSYLRKGESLKPREVKPSNSSKGHSKVKRLASGTPEEIKDTLEQLVKGANKVTADDRKIIENYLKGEPNPNQDSTIKIILLNETRKFADDSKTMIILEQIKLKIDYENRTLKKLKGVKKYKLKTT